jgi:hypothetical protein
MVVPRKKKILIIFFFQMLAFLKTNLIFVIWVENLLRIGVIKKGSCYLLLFAIFVKEEICCA